MLYVTPSTPDIMQAVGMILIFHSSPKETNVHAVKRIFIYLKGTLDLVLWNPHSDNLKLEAYTNAHWERSFDNKKRTRGETFFLGKCLISWIINKKYSVSLSIAEAE